MLSISRIEKEASQGRHWRSKDLPFMHFPRVPRIAVAIERSAHLHPFGLSPALLPGSAVTLDSSRRLPSANNQPQPQPASSPMSDIAANQPYMNRRIHDGSRCEWSRQLTHPWPLHDRHVDSAPGCSFTFTINTLPVAVLFKMQMRMEMDAAKKRLHSDQDQELQLPTSI